MDELEHRRRTKAFHKDPMGELTRSLDEATSIMIGALERHRLRRNTFLGWYASIPLWDLLCIVTLYATPSVFTSPVTAKELASCAAGLIVLRLVARLILIRRYRRRR